MGALRIVLLLFLISIAGISVDAQKVYVLPVETEIDQSAFHHVRKGIEKASMGGADLLLIRMNTYGGALDAADSIRTALLRCPLPTVAFVDVNAASAGALIALACDSVFMAPAASMGSATVVNGVGEPMPEKYQSYMSTIMRATAEHHGKVMKDDSLVWRRSPEIAASMVNPELSVSLTSHQAIECGYAEGIAPDIASVLADLDMAGAELEYYTATFTDTLLGFLSNAGVRAILITLILGGLYIEMRTAGLGFAAAVAVIAAVLYFLPMFVIGSVPSWVLLLFLAGVVLIAMEIFVIPGFGICGISGIIAIVISLVWAMTSSDSVTGFDMRSIGRALIVVASGSVLAAAIILYLTSSHGPRFFRRHSELMTELTVADGFIGVDMEPARFVGQIAVAATVLRPAGKIEIGDHVFDAVSTGEFIAKGKKVKILRYENAQLYVSEYEG